MVQRCVAGTDREVAEIFVRERAVLHKILSKAVNNTEIPYRPCVNPDRPSDRELQNRKKYKQYHYDNNLGL